MPVIREHLSISQFSELVGIDPARFNGVEVDRRSSRVTIVLEPELCPEPKCELVIGHAGWHKAFATRGDGADVSWPRSSDMNTSGTIPQLNTGGKTIGGKKGKGGKRGC